jgi:hypothetical protein
MTSTATKLKRDIYETPKQMTTTTYVRQENRDIYLNPEVQFY